MSTHAKRRAASNDRSAGSPNRASAASSRFAALPELKFPDELPVSQRRDEIARLIAAHPVVIVCGETGSGKTTQLPKICALAGCGVRGRIGHTQPRRLAATTVARRIAQELGSPLGEHVGYKIRFADKIAPSARIKLMTDGVLLAETQSDPLLSGYDTIIVDEAHERSLNIDFLLGYLKQLVEGARRDSLKLIITSATIDAERFARHFGQHEPAPVIEVSGRLYPVEVRYRPAAEDQEFDLPASIEQAIDECWRERPGDVLVFLPGEREIRDAQAHLNRAFAAANASAATVRRIGPVEVLPLYSRLSAAEQDRIFATGAARRVVLATNVAETSLTVPGIRYVIDPGLARVKRYRYRNRIEQLQIEPISRASANQRAGRCGRVSDGVCIRLYGEDDFDQRPAFTDPEVLRSSLAGVILRMKSLKLGDIEDFPFIDPPPKRAIVDGRALLAELAAIEPDGELTDIGRMLAKLPLDPKIGRMLLAAREVGSLSEALVIAAALSVQDPRDRPLEAQQAADQAHQRFADERSDFIGWLKLWCYVRRLKADDSLSNRATEAELRRSFLSPRRLREWAEVQAQLSTQLAEQHWAAPELTEKSIPEPTDTVRYAAIHRPLLTGLLSAIGMRNPDEPHYQGPNGIRFWCHPGSALAKRGARWVMAAELTETSKLYARTVARIDPNWIEELGAHLIKRAWSEPHWEKRAGQIVAIEKGTLYGLTIYAQRRVHFAAREPALARQLLIRHALVEGDWDSPLPFFAHNRKLIAEIERLEHKIRRPDLLVDDQFLFNWYDAALPESITTAAQLERWVREASRSAPDVLKLSRDALIKKEADGVSSEQFPRSIEMSGIDFALDYLFEPGSPRDGVTMTVPIYALNQVDARRCDWLVPGMLVEKVAALIKSLPPRPRHRCQPIAELAQSFVRAHGGAGAGRTLIDALTQAVREQVQLPITTADFKPDMVSAHLRMRFSIVDRHGRELAAGRELAPLRERFSEQASRAFREVALGAATADRAAPHAHAQGPAAARAGAPSPEASSGAYAGAVLAAQTGAPTGDNAAISAVQQAARSGQRYTAWHFGELPEIMELSSDIGGQQQTLIGYPALIDADDAVELQVFDDPDQAGAVHRAGLTRLFALQLKEALKQLTKSLPDAQRMAMLFAPFGSTEDLHRQMVNATLARTCLSDPLPRDAAGFAQRLTEARPRIGPVGQELARTVLVLLIDYAQLQRKLKESKAFAAAVADVEQQAGALLPKNFIVATPVSRFGQLSRYLKAMLLRLDKLRADPARDAARSAELAPILQNLRRLIIARKGRLSGPTEDFRWLVEELRVSLFAQELRTPGPISVKRLNKLWEQLSL